MRNAFTIVELLVAIAIITIISGMVLVGLNSAQQDSRTARTKSLVQRINSVVQEKYDEYRMRKLPTVLVDAAGLPIRPAPNAAPFNLSPREVSRVRLMMIRDLMRMEMPDRISDIFDLGSSTVTGPIAIRAIASQVGPSGTVTAVTATNLQWTNPSRWVNYTSRITSTWTPEHESAECLYLFISTSTLNGVSALDLISPANVEDTDGDGMPEIVDAWENPIVWIRWPAGYPTAVIANAGPDEFDLLNSDWGHSQNAISAGIAPSTSLIPAVVSAGVDGELGIVTSEYPTTPYPSMMWPDSQTDGNSRAISGSTYPYVDPFNRQAPTEPLPGSIVDSDAFADNISSFNL